MARLTVRPRSIYCDVRARNPLHWLGVKPNIDARLKSPAGTTRLSLVGVVGDDRVGPRD